MGIDGPTDKMIDSANSIKKLKRQGKKLLRSKVKTFLVDLYIFKKRFL